MPIVAAILVGIAVAVMTAALLLPTPRVAGTAKALQLIRDSSLDPARSAQANRGWHRNRAVGLFARLGARISPAGTSERLAHRLDQVGPESFWTAQTVLALKAIGTLGLGGLGLAVWLRKPGLLTLALAVAFVVLGYLAANVLLQGAISRRRQEIRASAADVLDMLTVCVEAGLGFDAAMRQVAENARGPLAEEFSRVLSELKLGRGRAEAFQDMAKRCEVVEVSNFVAALVQADRLGVPLAGVLREQAAELRLRRRQYAEEEAQKIPVKIIFPVLFCIFPAFFVIIIGPAAINIAKVFSGV